MADIEFNDNSAEVKAALSGAVRAYLYEAGGELQGQTYEEFAGGYRADQRLLSVQSTGRLQ